MTTSNPAPSSYRQRVRFLILLVGAGLGLLLLIPPFPQPLAYHQFADSREWFGINNFNDVASNIGFLLVGLTGSLTVIRFMQKQFFVHPDDHRPYILFFAAIFIVSIGSGYYHLDPTNERLFWDRLPMSVAFMSLLAMVVADRIHRRAGNGWLLGLMVVLGITSLVYWIVSEKLGNGDLRFYVFIQFYPAVLLPVILFLFREYHYTRVRYLLWLLAWYALSKVFEFYDHEIFHLTSATISGHTLKHLVAAASSLVVLRMLQWQHQQQSLHQSETTVRSLRS